MTERELVNGWWITAWARCSKPLMHTLGNVDLCNEPATSHGVRLLSRHGCGSPRCEHHARQFAKYVTESDILLVKARQ